MALAHNSTSTGKAFLDSGQYSHESILKYEQVYGRTFVSPGGRGCAIELIEKLDLKPGSRVLDVGCGIGGSAFLMKQKFNLEVDAIDLSDNMLDLAEMRLAEAGLTGQVSLANKNCLEIATKDAYDGIYSRDVFLHIKEKKQLFARLFHALKPSVKLLFTDYCCAEGPFAEDFKQYISQRNYHLCSVSEYQALIEEAGFKGVEAADVTKQFIDFSEAELKTIQTLDIDQNVREELTKDWQRKIDRARSGAQRWGRVVGRKPAETID